MEVKKRPPIPPRRPGGTYFGNLFIDNPVTEEEYNLVYYHLQGEVTCGGNNRGIPARQCAHCVEALVRMIRDARGQIPRVYANFEKEQEAIP